MVKEGYSKIRYKALAHAFLYMNMIEEWGSGIPRLYEEMEEYGLGEPEFVDMEIGFRVNLYRGHGQVNNSPNRIRDIGIVNSTDQYDTKKAPVELKNSASNTEKCDYEPKNCSRGPKQDDLSHILLDLLSTDPKITQKELSRITHVSISTVKRYLSRMQTEGILRHEGSRRNGTWVMNDDSNE